MKDAHEHDLRIKAIRLYDDGIGFNEILRRCLTSAKFGQRLISPKLWFPIAKPS